MPDVWAKISLKENDDRIAKCKHCDQDIVFLQSKRNGNWYPVNYVGMTDVVVNDFHRCGQESIVGKF